MLGILSGIVRAGLEYEADAGGGPEICGGFR